MNPFRLTLASPVGNEATCAFVPHGLTIAQAIGEGAAYSTEVRMGGQVIPRERWAHIKPKPGLPVEVMLYPQGGNAGKWVRLVAMIVIMYFSMGAASGMFATSGGMFAAGSMSAGLLAAGISIVGAMSGPALTAQGATA